MNSTSLSPDHNYDPPIMRTPISSLVGLKIRRITNDPGYYTVYFTNGTSCQIAQTHVFDQFGNFFSNNLTPQA